MYKLAVPVFIVLASTSAIAVAASTPASTWTASSTASDAVTGDLKLHDGKIEFAGKSFRLSLRKRLTGLDLTNAAKLVSSTHGPNVAALYRTKVPADTMLLDRNTLCGKRRDALWMILVKHPDFVRNQTSLSLAVFTGEDAPNLDPVKVEHSMALCGIFGYSSTTSGSLPR